MPISLDELMAPRLRWGRLAAMIAPASLAILLLISLAMPPVSAATLKGVVILLCTLVSLTSVGLSLYIIVTRDEEAASHENRASATREQQAATPPHRSSTRIGVQRPERRSAAAPQRGLRHAAR